MNKLIVKKAAVLGAGVMGAQIAAHLANANVPVVLFDLPAKEGDKNGVVKKALDGLKKLDPAPLSSKGKLKFIDAANYDEHLPLLAECDLVIEAIAERMDWKNDLYAKIAPHLKADAIIASNTSGLSMNALAQGLPEAVRPRFCGIHFFNPPRYMHLVEIIGTQSTDAATLDALETWLTSRLGKGVIRALDTPNFVANRIGVFSILAVMHHTAAFGLGFDEVDALTGPRIGRPKSATYRTADVVGLDTLAHVVNTMQYTLPNDPWHAYFTNPAWLQALIAKGALGQKTRCGIFRKQGKEIQVLDLASPGLPQVGRRNRRGSRRHPQDQVAGREVCRPARLQRIRRRNSCGPSSATSSITPPCNSKASPTTPATSISPCAGASAGARDRSKPGRPPAGPPSPRPSPPTSPPARP